MIFRKSPLAVLVFWAVTFTHGVEIQMGVKPGLKFDLPGFHVLPGERVKLTFTNNDEMMHNIVFTSPGKRMQVVEAAIALGAQGLEKQFVPEIPAVLAYTPIVMPGQKFVLEFKASKESGEYPYVCTFPGHGFIMHGTMFVSKERPEALDGLLKKSSEELTAEPTDFPLSKAKLVRTFMPGSSPAAIAVALPGGHAYCWDAGNCRLRYAWRGGFIQRHGSYGRWRTLPTLLGPVYYREPHFPLRFMDNPDVVPSTQFLGYRFIDGIPEFRYRVGPSEVREFIVKLPGRSGLVRRFSFKGLKQGVQFRRDNLAGVEFISDKGTWIGDTLHLSAADAVEFTLEMVEVADLAPTEYWSMDDLTRHYSSKGRLTEGHLGRAWLFDSSPVIPTEHAFGNFADALGLSFWIRVSNPAISQPSICGWGENGSGPVLSYDGVGFHLGTTKELSVPNSGQLEAESAKVQGASIASKNRGHAGSGYVDFSKDVGESIEWIFQVERAGEYLLRFRYALPGGGRPLKVELDGAVLVASYAFADSKTWESWQNADIPVRLELGNHVVRLSSIGSSGPNVDYLAILNTDEAPNFYSPTPDSSPSGKPLLAKEVWHHVAVSASNGKATFFLDGEKLGVEPFLTESFARDTDFYLGPKLRGGPFKLDEFRLYSRPLEEAEIKELLAR